MRWLHEAPRLGCLLALTACAATAPVPAALPSAVADTPADGTVRLCLAEDHVASAAVTLSPGSLPPAARKMADAIAPDGETRFVGREWGPRGTGFRIEKAYREPEHRRSVLVDEAGAVLERAHTMPLARVPQHVLATALRTGPVIDEAWIVSGPLAEEHWTLVVVDRAGVRFVVRIGLDGTFLARWRRVAATVDA
jgi:hypothetical protein